MMMSRQTSSRPVVPLAAAVVACSLATLYFFARKRPSINENKDDVIVELLPIEKAMAAGAGGDNAMSSLTWYQGDYEKAQRVLHERAAFILQANPWLAGRVVKRNGKWVLIYNPSQNSVEDYFHCNSEIILSRNTPMKKLIATPLSLLLLKDGPTQPLFRITMVPCHDQPETYFALVVSMSHIVADGATFYNIINMLNFSEPVTSMIVARINDSPQRQVQAMGGEEEYGILTSLGFIVNCILGIIRGKLVSRYKTTSQLYFVDKEKMKQTKLKSAKGVACVSTNDVLTSWFLQESHCRYGFMALNFRGRLEGHSHQHAGNYENVLFYQRQDSATPALIRKSLDNNTRRIVTRHEPMPTFLQMITGSFAMASNWSSFYKPSVIPNCNEEMHFPLYDFSRLVPSNLTLLIIFQASPTVLGILVAGTPDKIKGLGNVSFLST